MSELRACPFCGGKAILTERTGGWTVDCENSSPFDCAIRNSIYCNSGMPELYESDEMAIKAWNTRPLEDALSARIQAIIHEVQKYQPVGSPPPGDEVMLTRWIMQTLSARIEELSASNTKLREALTELIRVGKDVKQEAISQDAFEDVMGENLLDEFDIVIEKAEEALK